MPCLSIKYTPKVGPLLQVAIALPTFKPPQSPIGDDHGLVFYTALIDTGASYTCISGKIVKELKIPPIGKQLIHGVHGPGATNQYQFQIGLAFPQSQDAGGIIRANLATFLVNGVEFVPSGSFDVLLGRDILCNGSFTMSFDGHATFCI